MLLNLLIFSVIDQSNPFVYTKDNKNIVWRVEDQNPRRHPKDKKCLKLFSVKIYFHYSLRVHENPQPSEAEKIEPSWSRSPALVRIHWFQNIADRSIDWVAFWNFSTNPIICDCLYQVRCTREFRHLAIIEIWFLPHGKFWHLARILAFGSYHI